MKTEDLKIAHILAGVDTNLLYNSAGALDNTEVLLDCTGEKLEDIIDSLKDTKAVAPYIMDNLKKVFQLYCILCEQNRIAEKNLEKFLHLIKA